jgi:hypothetical protein
MIRLALLVAALGIVRAALDPLSHDAAWMHYVAARVLDGARLYVDLIEINPPLTIWLSVPAVLLERLTGIGHAASFPFLVAAGAAASGIASYRIGRGAVEPGPQHTALGLGLALVLFVVPVGEWGQREHLMLILCMPHVISAAVRLRGGAVQGWIPVGIAAGIGYSLKPHFALCFLALEALVWLRTRTVWRGALVTVGVAALYLLSVLVLVPDYLTMVWAIREAYDAFVSRTPVAIVAANPVMAIALAALLLAFVPGPARELRIVLATATAAWIAAVLIQSKGFAYHVIPVTAGVVLLAFNAAAVLWKRHGTYAAAALAIAAAVYVNVRPESRQDLYWSAASFEVEQAMRAEPGLMVLTTDVAHVWPAGTYAGASWPARVPALWPFLSDHPSAYPLGATWATEALAARPPVLVPRTRWNDPLPRLLEFPEFRAAWNGYEVTDSLGWFMVYRNRSAHAE